MLLSFSGAHVLPAAVVRFGHPHGGGLGGVGEQRLILVGIPSTWQKVIIGAFIIAAGSAFGWRKYR